MLTRCLPMIRKRSIIYILILIAVVAGVLVWYGGLGKSMFSFLKLDSGGEPKQLLKSSTVNQRASSVLNSTEIPNAQTPAIKKISIPKPTELAKINETLELQQSPPLPKIAPEASQDERQDAYGLKNSVDFIVRSDEPFEIAGEKLTVDELLKRLHSEQGQNKILSNIQELDLGSSLRKSIKPPFPTDTNAAAYYAVRVVLPGENLWNIHYTIIQEYLARRHITLAPRSDEPFPNGQSSGIGRLLKFIEGVVYVYNLNQNRLERDLNLIHPHEIIIFFKISDLFEALDRLQPNDFQNLRYVSNSLRLEHSGQCTDLLDRQALAK